MAKIEWIILIIALIFIFYFLPPNNNYPKEMLDKVNELSRVYPDDLEFARATFTFIVGRWESPIRRYLKEPAKPFLKDMTIIWNVPIGSYQSSNVETHLYQRMLLLSGRFKRENLIIHNSVCEISPHGFLEIKNIGGIDIFADTWAVEHGAKFGQYANPPCNVPADIIGRAI